MIPRALAVLAVLALAAQGAPAIAAPARGSAFWQARLRAARAYVAHRRGLAHIAVVAGGRLYGWHSVESVPAASTIKPFLMVAYLDRIDVRRRALRSSEGRVLRSMIDRSDNVAATRVYDYLSPRWKRTAARSFGLFHLTLPRIDWGSARTTAAEQARFFSTIRQRTAPLHRAFTTKALASVVPSQRWGAAQARPPGWLVLCKNGWGSPRGELAASLALFQRGTQTVTIAVYMTGSPSLPYGEATIRGAAREIMRGV